MFIIIKKNRALTNRERARIQIFDDKYKFVGKKEEVRKQIGMAVPVLLLKKFWNQFTIFKKHRKQIGTYIISWLDN